MKTTRRRAAALLCSADSTTTRAALPPGERAFPYGPENQRISKTALLRAGVEADLALTGREATQLAARMTPPYSMVFASSEIPYSDLTTIQGVLRRRSPDRSLFFLIHHPQKHQVDHETETRLLNTVDYVYRRPLATSRIQAVMWDFDSVTATKYEETGESAHMFWERLCALYDNKV